tara:strand:- start:13033 stop:15162 length:2130 start_codon:yes stop_codon:yes gene_type:complete
MSQEQLQIQNEALVENDLGKSPDSLTSESSELSDTTWYTPPTEEPDSPKTNSPSPTSPPVRGADPMETESVGPRIGRDGDDGETKDPHAPPGLKAEQGQPRSRRTAVRPGGKDRQDLPRGRPRRSPPPVSRVTEDTRETKGSPARVHDVRLKERDELLGIEKQLEKQMRDYIPRDRLMENIGARLEGQQQQLDHLTDLCVESFGKIMTEQRYNRQMTERAANNQETALGRLKEVKKGLRQGLRNSMTFLSQEGCLSRQIFRDRWVMMECIKRLIVYLVSSFFKFSKFYFEIVNMLGIEAGPYIPGHGVARGYLGEFIQLLTRCMVMFLGAIIYASLISACLGQGYAAGGGLVVSAIKWVLTQTISLGKALIGACTGLLAMLRQVMVAGGAIDAIYEIRDWAANMTRDAIVALHTFVSRVIREAAEEAVRQTAAAAAAAAEAAAAVAAMMRERGRMLIEAGTNVLGRVGGIIGGVGKRITGSGTRKKHNNHKRNTKRKRRRNNRKTHEKKRKRTRTNRGGNIEIHEMLDGTLYSSKFINGVGDILSQNIDKNENVDNNMNMVFNFLNGAVGGVSSISSLIDNINFDKIIKTVGYDHSHTVNPNKILADGIKTFLENFDMKLEILDIPNEELLLDLDKKLSDIQNLERTWSETTLQKTISDMPYSPTIPSTTAAVVASASTKKKKKKKKKITKRQWRRRFNKRTKGGKQNK